MKAPPFLCPVLPSSSFSKHTLETGRKLLDCEKLETTIILHSSHQPEFFVRSWPLWAFPLHALWARSAPHAAFGRLLLPRGVLALRRFAFAELKSEEPTAKRPITRERLEER